jgi:prepilin-type N-terminal cleavage/methylation domain-containing protein
MNRKDTSAFTLIEILIVIAIIGILASVVIRNVSGAKARAQEAKTIASLRSAQQVATYCMDDHANLNTPNISNTICAGQRNWPAPVGYGWAYGTAGTCGFDGDVSDNTFLYCATNGTKTVTCTQNGCTTN